jgi:SAM-dependent methyltransferase
LIFNFIYGWLCVWYFRIFHEREFSFNGKKYFYFWGYHNKTWTNERMVEIPIVRDIVKTFRPEVVLEVGNVLSHYFKVRHDIVDKFELRKNVINKDISDFHPDKKYNLIVSISTLEHIENIDRVFKNLNNLLTKDGMILFTIPVGYNKLADEYVSKMNLSFLRRISPSAWVQVDNLDGIEYNYPFQFANGVIVGIS